MSTPEMIVSFPGGKRVDAQYGKHVFRTDQPLPVGDDSAPSPFNLFLAAIATCAGIYVLGFCQSRGLPTEGIEIRQRATFDPATKVLAHVDIDIRLPEGFPEKYHEALIRVADQCAVKKAIAAQPSFTVKTVTPTEAATTNA